jgi:hypothetical protein
MTEHRTAVPTPPPASVAQHPNGAKATVAEWPDSINADGPF